MQLPLRTQSLQQGANSRSNWEVITTPKTLIPAETAIILCDLWNGHWSRGAAERVDEMAPRVDQVIRAARQSGVTILHAPSDTMEFYKDSPARRRVLEAPYTALPSEIPHVNPPLPIDDSDGGSDTGEKPWHRAWTRQHSAVYIDDDQDGISDDGQSTWNFLQHRSIKNILLMGVHTNMCVLHRPFGIKQMVKWGVNTLLVRDLTDSLYNPALPPYVSHDEGTRLVVEFIEKFWCPSVSSGELLEGLARVP